jgi:geranylgeranyl reductase family protein
MVGADPGPGKPGSTVRSRAVDRSETGVLVVGAGPAGSTVAHHLARRGLDVLMVDRATFPREKVCGDGLTPRAVGALLDLGVDPWGDGFHRVDVVRAHGPGGLRVEFPWPRNGPFPPVGLSRTRRDLDHLLVRRAIEAGVRFLQATTVEKPLIEDGRVVGAALHGQDETTTQVRAAFVVAADGASSRFATLAGVRRDPHAPMAVAARTYVRSAVREDDAFETFLTLRHDGRFLPGYGWIFPMGNGVLNVGAYLVRSERHPSPVSIREALQAFIRGLPADWEVREEDSIGTVGSAPIPMGVNRTPLVLPGLLVVGDAAGMVNPFTGEGIGYAMESGAWAARVISDSMAGGVPALSRAYPDLVRARYGRLFRAGRRFARGIGHPAAMRLGVTYGMRRTSLARSALRAMAHVEAPTTGRGERILHGLFSLAGLRMPGRR